MRREAKLLNDRQAAEFLNVSAKTIQRWRHAGQGPRYIKMCRIVRYREEDLLAFIEGSERAPTAETAEV